MRARKAGWQQTGARNFQAPGLPPPDVTARVMGHFGLQPVKP
jgi:hypothetical protein